MGSREATRPGPDVRRADVEGLVQLGLTLAVGAVAAVASWSHVLDLANRHGQSGGLAWAVAACIETTAVSAGLEVRRRRRHDQPVGFPLSVLVGATALQLAAQVAQAQRTPWGVVLAAVPAVTFLTLVKLVLARPRSRARQRPGTPLEPPAPAPPVYLAAPALDPAAARDVDVVVDDLLLVGRAVLDDLARDGLPLTRRTLLAGVRARGRSCSTERAGALLKALRSAEPTQPAEQAG